MFLYSLSIAGQKLMLSWATATRSTSVISDGICCRFVCLGVFFYLGKNSEMNQFSRAYMCHKLHNTIQISRYLAILFSVRTTTCACGSCSCLCCLVVCAPGCCHPFAVLFFLLVSLLLFLFVVLLPLSLPARLRLSRFLPLFFRSFEISAPRFVHLFSVVFCFFLGPALLDCVLWLLLA